MTKGHTHIDLVLEGGGVKGIGLVGALAELEKKKYTFQRVAGTSAGAIVGSLVAAGCPIDQIVTIMSTMDYKRFRDDTFLSQFGTVGKGLSLLTVNGLYKGDYFRDWIKQLLADCNVKTFADLRLSDEERGKIPKEKAYKLVVVTADLSKGELVYLPWDYHKYGLDPDTQPVADAVRASMSFPFFFRPARLKQSTFVDGGMLSNFPISIFDDKLDRPTIGIKLASKEEANLVPRSTTGSINFVSALFATLLNGHDQRHLNTPDALARTIFVDTGKVQTLNFDISQEEQDFLMKSGQQNAREFLKTWDFEKYQKLVKKHKIPA